MVSLKNSNPSLKDSFRREFLGFVAIGIASFLLDFAVLNGLIYLLKFNPYVFGLISIPNLISTTLALASSFLLNRIVNFKTTEERLHTQLGKYLLTTFLAWGVENLVFGLFVRLGLVEPLAKIAVYAIFTPVTFLVYKLVVFRSNGKTTKTILSEVLADISALAKEVFAIVVKILKSDLVKVLAIFVVSRLVIYQLGVIGYGRFSYPPIAPYSTEATNPESAWTKWDVIWYKGIALQGYDQEPFEEGQTEQENWGFMPLFPISNRLILQGLGTDKFFLVASIFSNVFSLAALYILFRMYKDKLKRPFDLILFFCLSAGSFYLSIPYAEGLFLFLTVMTIFFSKKKWWLPAALAAGLGFTTRIQGVTLILIPGICLLLEKTPVVKKLLLLSASAILFAIPIGAHMYYMYSISGNPLAFIDIQSAWYNSNPYPLKALVSIVTAPMSSINLLHILVWVLYGWIYIRNFRKLEIWERLFIFAMFLVSTSTEVFYSAYRYVLPLIPIFVAAADEKEWVKKLFIGANCAFAVIYILAFVTANPLAV